MMLLPEATLATPAEGEDEVFPLVPQTLEQTGLSPSAVEQLLLKLLYFRGELYGRDLAGAAGLKFSVIEALLETLKLQHFIEVRRSLGLGNVSAVFSITEAGRQRVRLYLESNQYAGAAPVPLAQFAALIRRQALPEGWLQPEALAQAYRHMVVTPRLLAQIGPAVSSRKSFLIYGRPGDGKTYLAEALAGIRTAPVFLPYAIEFQGNLIQFYDPIYHRAAAAAGASQAFGEEPAYDGRWFQCQRPFVTSGGELSVEMLDLSYNPVSKVYEAPLQLKATNGIYLVDDFGRQKASATEILNRWIVPMERRVDYLSFRTGGKMTVPFEVFLVFSTNLQPAQLGDEAFLRRIQYKLHVHGPSRAEFAEIFASYEHERGLPDDGALADWLIEKHFRQAKRGMRRCHPRDLLSHAIDILQFQNRPYRLTEEILDQAVESCFVQESQPEETPEAG